MDWNSIFHEIYLEQCGEVTYPNNSDFPSSLLIIAAGGVGGVDDVVHQVDDDLVPHLRRRPGAGHGGHPGAPDGDPGGVVLLTGALPLPVLVHPGLLRPEAEV